MNGYAIYGRDPVFADVDAHVAQLDADEARNELVSSMYDDAIDAMLDSHKTRNELDQAMFDGPPAALSPISTLIADRNATHWPDFFRLLMRAPVADSAEVLLNFRAWVCKLAAENSEHNGVADMAERLADKAEAEAAQNYWDSVAESRAAARGYL